MRSWKQLNITKKFHVIICFLLCLIAFQLLVLLFSISATKNIRTYVSGESILSKTHKSAVKNLTYYITLRDDIYYEKYLADYEIQEHFNSGRTELLKPQMDRKKVIRLLNLNGIDESDLVFSSYVYPYVANSNVIKPMIDTWTAADEKIDEIHLIAMKVRNDYQQGITYQQQDIRNILLTLYSLEKEVSFEERSFSQLLGGLSRKVENMVGIFLIGLILCILLIYVFFYSSLLKTFKRSTDAIKNSIDEAVDGNFEAVINIKPEDDIASITTSLKKMLVSFKKMLAERVNAEEAEARLRVLADAMPQLVCIKNASSEILFINQKIKDYFGIEDPSEANFYKYCHPDDFEKARKSQIASTLKKKISSNELRLKNKDGVYNWFLSRFEPILDDNGEIVRWYGSFTDIQSQKMTEIELAKAVEVRDQFLSITSHELKTPLTSMKLRFGMRKKLLEKGDIDKFTAEYLKKAVNDDTKDVNRLIKLVDDVLDITHIRAGQVSLEKSEFSLDELIIDVSGKFQPEFEVKKCTLKLNLQSAVQGQWDRYKIEQVITNLLTNALKYGNGSDVEVGCLKKDGKSCIYVKDGGLGIPKESSTRIFELFERVKNKEAIGGLGLGLYIVKEIVTAHSGRIYVESELGKGSTFFVEI